MHGAGRCAPCMPWGRTIVLHRLLNPTDRIARPLRWALVAPCAPREDRATVANDRRPAIRGPVRKTPQKDDLTRHGVFRSVTRGALMDRKSISIRTSHNLANPALCSPHAGSRLARQTVARTTRYYIPTVCRATDQLNRSRGPGIPSPKRSARRSIILCESHRRHRTALSVAAKLFDEFVEAAERPRLFEHRLCAEQVES